MFENSGFHKLYISNVVLNFTMKICIIKLGALGDVVRTTPILPAIKEKYPESEITWITKKESKEILEGNPDIKEILTIPVHNPNNFDIIYNFDIENEAIQLVNKIKADKKYGFYDNEGFPAAFDSGAEYYLNTVFDDQLKKSNRKTYQEMMFEIAGLKYKQQKPTLYISNSSKQFAEDFLKKNGLKDTKIIGINIGASSRWPSKSWSLEKLTEFIIKLSKLDYKIMLLGGVDEQSSMNKLSVMLNANDLKIYMADTSNSLKNFFAMVSICDKIITADSLALHVALALNKPTIALFFVTSPYEIEGYNLLTKIISPKLNEFFPEKSDQYNKELVNSISSEEVAKAV